MDGLEDKGEVEGKPHVAADSKEIDEVARKEGALEDDVPWSKWVRGHFHFDEDEDGKYRNGDTAANNS